MDQSVSIFFLLGAGVTIFAVLFFLFTVLYLSYFALKVIFASRSSIQVRSTDGRVVDVGLPRLNWWDKSEVDSGIRITR